MNEIIIEFTFLIPWHILHGQITCIRFTTVCYALYFNKIRFSQVDKLSVLFDVFSIPAFDQCQTINGSLLFRS